MVRVRPLNDEETDSGVTPIVAAHENGEELSVQTEGQGDRPLRKAYKFSTVAGVCVCVCVCVLSVCV